MNAERLRVAIELIAHLRHQFIALVAHRVGKRRGAEHAPQRRVEQDGELRSGAVRTDRLIEFERIGDAVARKGIDHEPLAGLGDARQFDLSWLDAITSCAGNSMLRMRLSI